MSAEDVKLADRIWRMLKPGATLTFGQRDRYLILEKPPGDMIPIQICAAQDFTTQEKTQIYWKDIYYAFCQHKTVSVDIDPRHTEYVKTNPFIEKKETGWGRIGQ